MQVQLERLFGSGSREAAATTRTATEWRKTLKSVLREIDRYITHNVDTDELHLSMLYSGLAADESLSEEDFWPGYAEGITRLALLLLGDYPDHRRRKPGRKKDNHYSLNRLRSVHWNQTPNQRLQTLLAAGAVSHHPQLSRPPREALEEFRREFGFGPGHREFLDWYRSTYPQDYAALFR